MRVIQLCESLSYGDGISNHTLLIQDGLRDAGIETMIYADSINEGVAPEAARPYTEKLKVRPDDVLLLQFGLGGRVAREIEKFKCRKMMYFHNITPAHFLAGFDNKAAVEIIQGYRLAHKWVEDGTFDAVLTCSSFNRDTLLEIGFPEQIITCVPGPLMMLPEDDITPDARTIKEYSDWRTNILFVGRISPNKKQDDIIQAFAYYQKHFDRGARLFLIGGGSDSTYGQTVRKYVSEIGVQNVIFPGHLTDEEIVALYECADVFLCMSEHEGFCNPIMEAMYYDVPVIAYAAAAIPETMGGAGVLLQEKDPVLTAKWIDRLVHDTALRERILAGQRKRINEFQQNGVTEKTTNAIIDFAKAPRKIKVSVRQ